MKMNDFAHNLMTWTTISQWVLPWLLGWALGGSAMPDEYPTSVAAQHVQTHKA